MSTIAAEAFDPYRDWLKVRESRRPLNAYQLLGLSPLDGGAERIRAAADRQRAALELHRAEAHPAVWQQVNQELEDAIHMLIDADLKTAYDLALRSNGHGGAQKSPRAVSPVAASPNGPGDGIPCNVCGMANPGTRKFCAHCGRNLWQTCTQCGTLSVAGEKFCGACGTNLAAARQQLVAQFEGLLEQARACRDEFRFDEGLKLLSSVLSVEHRYLDSEHTLTAKRLMEEIVNQRDLGRLRADAALADAQRLIAERRYGEAVAKIEPVAPGFRPPQLQELYEQAWSKHQEILQLEAELKDPQTLGSIARVTSCVKRILAIQPDHAQALWLAEKLTVRLYHAARQRLAKFAYEEALQLLDEIPENVRPEVVVKARERVEDLAWLARNMRTAPVLDGALWELAKRWTELAPRDPTAARILGEVERRRNAMHKAQKFAVPPWAKAPAASIVGPPLQWLTGFRHLDIQPVRQSEAFLRHPGCFYVAAGLALQGLGQAQLQTNLCPSDAQSMIARVARMMPRRTARSAWGIDLGSAGLKAVRMTWNEEGRIALGKCDYVEHRKLLSQANDDKESQRILEESLQTFRQRNEFKGDHLCVGVPGLAVLHRMLRLPPLPTDSIESAIHGELRQMFSQLKQELISAYHVLESPQTEGAQRGSHDVVLVVGRRDRLAGLLGSLQKAGLSADILQSDCLALHNYLAYEYLPQKTPGEAGKPASGAIAMLDIGGDSTNVVISSPQAIWMSSVGMGANRVTKNLVQEFGLSYAEAERLKREPAKAPQLARLYAALEPVFEDFAADLRTALEQFRRVHPGYTIQRVAGMGGGMLMHGLLKYLQSGT